MSDTIRTEYGALVVSKESNVHMRAYSKAVVAAWITEFGTVTPVQLVIRHWTGETHTAWELAA